MVITGQKSYRCAERRLHPERCDNTRGIPLARLEATAVRQLLAWLRDPDRDWPRMFASAGTSSAAKRHQLKQKIATATSGIAHLVAAVESGVTSPSFRERVLELERARSEAEAALASLPAPSPGDTASIRAFMRSWTDPFRGVVTSSDSERSPRREETLLALRDLISRIQVTPSSGPYRVDVTTTPDVPAILDLIARRLAAGPTPPAAACTCKDPPDAARSEIG